MKQLTKWARHRDRLVLSLVAVALLVVAPSFVLAAPSSTLLEFWNASDETNTETIDHSAWQNLLTTYLSSHPSGVNRFDYAALKANAEDTAKLADYLAHLQAHDPRTYPRAEQKAYWINFYNALTVQVVVNAYPVDSIRDIHESWIPLSGPWDDVHAHRRRPGTDAQPYRTRHPAAHLARQPDSLRGELRQLRLSESIANGLYRGQHRGIRARARLYQSSARSGFRGRRFPDDFELYNWYVEDFGNSQETVFAHLIRYAEAGLAARGLCRVSGLRV